MSSDLTEGDCVNTGFSFDENTTAYLGELQKTGRLPHAIIIESPDVQKGMDLAVYLSMFAVCSGEEKPCGACKNCQNARSKAHSDIFYPQLQPKKKAYQVEQMRDLIKDAYILPNEADAKVYIFEDCDALTAIAFPAGITSLPSEAFARCIAILRRGRAIGCT